jgi:Holliday junction resolvasome RuvABC endonuclease subunit
MRKHLPKYPRILGIAPSTRGFGFALIEGLNTLADWGVKSIRGDKNAGSVAGVTALLHHYQPDVVVLENTSAKDVRRSARIRALTKRIASAAESQNVRVILVTRDHVRQVFFTDGRGTKHALAELIAKRFSDELGFRLPPKRHPWMSEDSRMSIFDAVALAQAARKVRR